MNVLTGNIIEFGIYKGYTFNLLMDFFGENYNYSGYDSFIGLSEPHHINDNVFYNGCHKSNLSYAKNKVIRYLQSNANYEKYNIKLYEGYVSETVPHNLPDEICFAHVDLDLYEPTLHILRNIIPRMVKGGIIIIDDYKDNNWVGIENSIKIIESEFDVKVKSLNLPVSSLQKYPVYQGYIEFV